jgi:membrane protease YdiL (CAAX protease family)
MKKKPATINMKNQGIRLLYVFGLCVLLLILFHIGALIKFILYRIFNIPYDSIFANITEIFVHLVIFIIVIAVGLKDQKKTLGSVCFFKKVNGAVWGAAILCSIGYTLFSFYLHFLFYSFKYGWYAGLAETEGHFLYNMIDLAIIPAVAEEILFKGVIFTNLKKYYSQGLAVIIASLMFAALHLSSIRIIPLFLLSCYTFWLYLRIGSLLIPMLMHFINNLFTFVLISEPFANLLTFYAALSLLAIGSYMLYNLSKPEKNLQKEQ